MQHVLPRESIACGALPLLCTKSTSAYLCIKCLSCIICYLGHHACGREQRHVILVYWSVRHSERAGLES